MKKILTLLICLFLIVGCKKEPTTDENKSTTTTIPVTTKYTEPDIFTETDMNRKLYNFAIKLYNDKEYTKFDKKDNKYFISLTKLVSDYKFDDSKFINSKDKTACDHENTGIYFDIDNVEKINYKEYPILIAVFCR